MPRRPERGQLAPDRVVESGPQRRCIVTGATNERSLLIRFVASPEGALVPDLATRLPGRGLWLTARRDIVERAVTKRLFARAARRSVSPPPGLADRLEQLLAERCIDAIGLARRAGLAVGGFEKVREAVRTGKAALVVAALDGAEGGRRKLRDLAHDLPLAVVLTRAELGAAFGREEVVQAAIGAGPLCDRLVADAQRLSGFRERAALVHAGEPATRSAGRQEDSIGTR